ncbi:hypothetical protein [Streptomyces cyanogenus]|uniref:Uncharacterized protein n=1 Tax=Streptomyces cyanogenus TaxID=80860 RepID=A0ABX7TNY9_STRCY|nr:hypothetical protein [Streptomyces cyanogenus]QTD97035.1 hypothetical protein S1361_06700 [Streptomyces cyanogenus]
MPQVSPNLIAAIDTIDLSEAADTIRPTNSALADLLDAVDDVERDSLHTMVEWPNGETECNEDCAPCTAKYAAQVVAHQYLRAMARAAS